MTLLAAQNLSCERDGRILFEALDLQLEAGELVELRGANGAGKSTLLRILADLLVDYEGDIALAGDQSPLYIGHRSGLSTLLTPRQNLAWFTSLADAKYLHGASELETEQIFAQLGLSGYEDVSAAELSAGQQRRAALSRLLVSTAPVWLLDEPLTALDDAGAQMLASLVAAHCADGGAALVATHAPLPAPDPAVSSAPGDFTRREFWLGRS